MSATSGLEVMTELRELGAVGDRYFEEEEAGLVEEPVEVLSESLREDETGGLPGGLGEHLNRVQEALAGLQEGFKGVSEALRGLEEAIRGERLSLVAGRAVMGGRAVERVAPVSVVPVRTVAQPPPRPKGVPVSRNTGGPKQERSSAYPVGDVYPDDVEAVPISGRLVGPGRGVSLSGELGNGGIVVSVPASVPLPPELVVDGSPVAKVEVH